MLSTKYQGRGRQDVNTPRTPSHPTPPHPIHIYIYIHIKNRNKNTQKWPKTNRPPVTASATTNPVGWGWILNGIIFDHLVNLPFSNRPIYFHGWYLTAAAEMRSSRVRSSEGNSLNSCHSLLWKTSGKKCQFSPVNMDVLDFLGKSVVIEWSFTLWLFNIAMKNVLRTVISIATLNDQSVSCKSHLQKETW